MPKKSPKSSAYDSLPENARYLVDVLSSPRGRDGKMKAKLNAFELGHLASRAGEIEAELRRLDKIEEAAKKRGILGRLLSKKELSFKDQLSVFMAKLIRESVHILVDGEVRGGPVQTRVRGEEVTLPQNEGSDKVVAPPVQNKEMSETPQEDVTERNLDPFQEIVAEDFAELRKAIILNRILDNEEDLILFLEERGYKTGDAQLFSKLKESLKKYKEAGDDTSIIAGERARLTGGYYRVASSIMSRMLKENQ